uniref:Uncharacterized protein n=1 Tax=Avena sativa TaxID=4498 RepID=A0ACD5WWV8_AVESA
MNGQEISQKNSDNRKKLKTKHIVGSKSYSQLSFEQRNLETGEEPDCIALWELAHMKNGTWANQYSQAVYDKACEEIQNKENETQGPISSEQRSNIFQTAYKDTLKCKSPQPRGYGYMAKPPSGSKRIRSQLENQARAQAETQKVNSVLTNRVTELQDQLLAERESKQERINLERAERENLEKKLKEERVEREKLLKEERAERDRLLEEERRSRMEFERNMMSKFAQLSEQMGTKQTQANQTSKKTTGKENSNPSLQNTLLKTASPTGAVGTRHHIISQKALIQAATKNNRQFRAMDSNI